MADCSLIKKEIILGGLNCAHCAEEINEKVSKMNEVESSNLNFINKKLTLNIINSSNEEEIINNVIDIINSTEPGLNIEVVNNSKNIKRDIVLGGLNCAHCAEVINEKVSKLEGIESSNLNFISKKLSIEIKKSINEKDVIKKIVDIINDTEPGLDIQINYEKSKTNKVTRDENKIDVDKKDLVKLIITKLLK